MENGFYECATLEYFIEQKTCNFVHS